MQIGAFKIVTHVRTAMIGCTIPTKNKSLFGVVLPKIFDKDNGPLGITGWEWYHTEITRERVDCSIIGLSRTLVPNRKCDTSITRPPHIAARIIPCEMTFVKVKDDHLFLDNSGCERR